MIVSIEDSDFGEVQTAMRQMEKLLDTIKHNEETARKFFEVEMSVLSTLNFEDFFEKLLGRIKEKFDIPYVWISMISSSRAYRLMKSFVSAELLQSCLTVIDKEDFLDLLGYKMRPLLVNESLDRFRALFPDYRNYRFRSLAIVPIYLDGQIVGSLNHADDDRERFLPGDDTVLLEQLGVVVSICLSNVAAHEELKSLAFCDPLTGFLNRRAMDSALQYEISRSQRYKAPLSLAFIDLNDFKKINDCYGHDRGDEVLCHMASCLREISRENDILSRFAGDEFVIILPGTGTLEAEAYMSRVAIRLRERPLHFTEGTIEISMSYGIATWHMGDTADQLLKKADEKLYLAKAHKNRR
jgi:diguanylate cyclase (GGDEF)-like protein